MKAGTVLVNELSPTFAPTYGMGVQVTLTSPLNDGGNIGVYCAVTGENHYESATVATHRWTLTSVLGSCYIYSWYNSKYRAGLSGAGTYATTVPVEPPPGSSSGTLSFAGAPETSPSPLNRLTGFYTPAAGSTITIVITTALNDAGNIGVYCTASGENHYGPASVGSYTYTISSPGNCYVYSWYNSAFRAWLTGAGTYSYATPGATPTPTPTPSPTPTPTAVPSPTASPIPGTDPTAVTSWNGQSQTGLAPPDPTGAIGPSSYLQLINLRYGLYKRDGSLMNTGDLGALTALPVSELSDPQVVWDPSAQRYYYLALDVARLSLAFGYSMSADPQSSSDFCHYILNYGYGNTLTLPDYPKMAVTNDFVLIGVNTFLLLTKYNGSDLDWIHKPTSSTCPASLSGGQFTSLKNADGSLTSTPEPAVNADPSSVGWVVGTADPGTGSANLLSVFQVTKDANGNPVLGPATDLRVQPYSVPASAPQPGTTATLDTLDTRLEHAVAAYDPRIGQTAIWTAHAVFGGAGSEVRWYEIGTAGTPSLAQSGAVTSQTSYVWNPAIAPDRADDGNGNAAYGSDMVIGFNTSSPNAFSAIQMVSKRGADPQSNWVLIKQSLGPNIDNTCGPVCRWGDYSGANADPLVSAGGEVWLSGEWNNPATDGTTVVWQTWNWAARP